MEMILLATIREINQGLITIAQPIEVLAATITVMEIPKAATVPVENKVSNPTITMWQGTDSL